MKPHTGAFLERANENRLVAERIIADPGSTPGSIRWACVMTFYSALQYVNAYLVEQWDAAPTTHAERETALSLFKQDLRPIAGRYRILKSKASYARYSERSQFTAAELRSLLDNELHAIRVAVLNSLPD